MHLFSTPPWSVTNISLDHLPWRGGVYFSIPWIPNCLVICRSQSNMPEIILYQFQAKASRSFAHFYYLLDACFHSANKIYLLEDERPRGTELPADCRCVGTPRQNHPSQSFSCPIDAKVDVYCCMALKFYNCFLQQYSDNN